MFLTWGDIGALFRRKMRLSLKSQWHKRLVVQSFPYHTHREQIWQKSMKQWCFMHFGGTSIALFASSMKEQYSFNLWKFKKQVLFCYFLLVCCVYLMLNRMNQRHLKNEKKKPHTLNINQQQPLWSEFSIN